ncbi:MAG TPA: SufS family cysteine desulfurase [Salinivirgaceae bacterium]|nr:SufS family cysteine desulfurase [Salinivirgaceae bacterium]
MDIQQIRDYFPILKQQVNGKPLVYFDNAATTQKPKVVIDTINEYHSLWNSNVHRGVHFLSNYCTEAAERARQKVANFINAAHEHEIIFTQGTTDSINLVAETFGREFISPGDEILVSQTEHHSNFVPWQQIALRKNATLVVFGCNEQGEWDLNDFQKKINGKTKIVALGHVSNALGVVNPIEKAIAIAHNHNIPVLVDGAQAVQHIPVDVQKLDVDFYAFSGHKIYGPTGIGVLYGKEKWLDKLPPYRFGGEMITKVTNQHTEFNTLPYKFEAGTPNYIGQIGLGAALEFISQVGLSSVSHHEEDLLRYAEEKLLQIDSITIYGKSKNKAGVVSFLVNGVHPYDIGVLLDKTGIAVRTGNHCAQPLMLRLGIVGTVRASFAVYNTKDEIDYFVAMLKKIIPMFL